MLLASSNPCPGSSRQNDATFAPVHTLELSSSTSQHSIPKESPTLEELVHLVPSLLARINRLEQQLTTTTKKVHKLEHVLNEL